MSSSEEEFVNEHLSSYCTPSSAVKLQHGHISSYDPIKLGSMYVLCTCSGTLFTQPMFWIETLATLVIGICSYGITVGFALDFPGIDDVATDFCNKVAALATFLLGFYTSLVVARWWRLRTDGIGNMWSACSQLHMFLSVLVTKDPDVLSAIRRYARASLAIIFLKRRHGADNLMKNLDVLVSHGILREDEVQCLRAYGNNLAESIWTWVAEIVTALDDENRINSQHLLIFLLDRVSLGRSGAALICAQMGCPIPMIYVHSLGFLVKLHNIMLGICLGYIGGRDYLAGDQHNSAIVFVLFKVLTLPAFFNGLLLFNAEMHDPFGSERGAFPFVGYEEGFESDGLSYVQAAENLPPWLRKRRHERSCVQLPS